LIYVITSEAMGSSQSEEIVQSATPTPEGSVPNEGSVQNPAGSTVNPGGSTQSPDDSTQSPDGATQKLEDSTSTPGAQGSDPNLEVSTKHPEAVTQNPEGSTQSADTSMQNTEHVPPSLEDHMQSTQSSDKDIAGSPVAKEIKSPENTDVPTSSTTADMIPHEATDSSEKERSLSANEATDSSEKDTSLPANADKELDSKEGIEQPATEAITSTDSPQDAVTAAKASWTPNADAPEFVPGTLDGTPEQAWASMHAKGGAPLTADWSDYYGAIPVLPPLPVPSVPVATASARGLDKDSPRTALLTMCGAWGALSMQKPLLRSTLLEFKTTVPRNSGPPTELKSLKCVRNQRKSR